MATQQTRQFTEAVFRLFKPLVLVEIGACLGLMASLTAAALGFNKVLPLVLTLLPVGRTAWVLLHYLTVAAIVRGEVLVLRFGALAVRESTVPLWACAPEYQQSILGRLCNFGTIVVVIAGRSYSLRRIGQFRQLRTLIVERQAALLVARELHEREVGGSTRSWGRS